MDNDDLIARYERCKSDRRNIEAQWDDITTLVMPYRGDMYLKDGNTELAVDWRENRNVYDSTPIDAAQKLASNIHSKLTGSAARWFGLRFRLDELNGNSDAKEWLDDTAERVYQALQESNFALQAAEAYMDMVGYGTAAIVEEVESETEWEGLDFQSIPIKECFFEEDTKGKVINLYRRHYWTPLQIVDKFGEKDTPAAVVQRAEIAGAGQEREEVIFCVWKRRDKQDADTSKPLAAKERPFGWKYVLRSTRETIGKEGGYYEMPAFLPRWATTSDSQWGNSPAMLALPDIKSLNVLVELHTSALEKVVDPTILASEKAIIGNLLLGAGEVNVVRDADGVVPFESRANFPAIYQMMERYEVKIRQIFFMDQLELKESPAMTATEVSARYEMMQQTLGATVARLQTDFLDPCIERTVRILSRANQLKPIPDVVLEAGSELDIEYVGPLNRSQKRDVVQTIDELVMSVAQMAQIMPNVLDNLDLDEAVRQKHKLLGAPAKVLRDEDDVAEKRAAQAQQAQQQQALDSLEQGASALDKFGKGAKALGEAENVTVMQQ